MTYHIASDEQIQSALNKIFKEHHLIQTQKKLKKLVLKNINTKKEKFGVTEARIRKLALKNKLVKIEIHSREGSPKKSMNKCPVCGSSLKKVKNKTIWGGEVTIEFSCPFCKYWTGKKKRIPTRYVFHSKISK